MEKTKKGISMIVLVITIVVMIILAGAVILTLTNTGIIGKANLAKVETDLSALKDEVKVKRGERELKDQDIKGTYKLSEWGITNSTYEDRVVIAAGELRVRNTGSDDEIEKAATELGIILKTDSTVLPNTKGENIVNYRIYGNSVQDGTPSPASPAEIKSLGDLVTDTKDVNYGMYKIPIRVGGKNLFNIKGLIFNGTSQYVKDFVTYENGFSFVRTSTNKTSLVYVDIYFEKGIYAIDGEIVQTDGKNGGYGIYDLEQKTYLVNDSGKGISTKTFSIPESKTYRLSFFCNYLSQENTKVMFSNTILTKEYNLIDVHKYYSGYLNGNGEMSYTEKDFANIKKIQIPVNTEEGKVYTYSCDYEIYSSDTENQTGNGISLQMLDENKKIITSQNVTSKGQKISGTVSISNNSQKKVAYVVMSYITATRDCTVKLKNIYVTENKENIDYVSYKEPKIYNIYLKEPLRRISSDIIDYIDFNEKKVVRNINGIYLTKNDGWVSETYGDYYVKLTKKKLGQKNILCSDYVIGTAANNPDQSCLGREENHSVSFYDTINGPTLDAWKEFLTSRNNENKPIYLQYELETPIEESIKMPNILTQRGGTIITVVGENGVGPSNIEVEY